jgi:hypothetical protein
MLCTACLLRHPINVHIVELGVRCLGLRGLRLVEHQTEMFSRRWDALKLGGF